MLYLCLSPCHLCASYIISLCLCKTQCDITHTKRVFALSLLRVSSVDKNVHSEQEEAFLLSVGDSRKGMFCGFPGMNLELLNKHWVIWASERTLGASLVRTLLWLKSKSPLWPEGPRGPAPHHCSHPISWLSLHHAVTAT